MMQAEDNVDAKSELTISYTDNPVKLMAFYGIVEPSNSGTWSDTVCASIRSGLPESSGSALLGKVHQLVEANCSPFSPLRTTGNLEPKAPELLPQVMAQDPLAASCFWTFSGRPLL